jgi:diguanylate cyclase (GGDEF)-like protein
VAMAMYAEHFLPPASARLHVGLLIALGTAGAVASPASGIALAWLIVVVTTVVLAHAHGHLIEAMRQAADRDPLTGLVNRRAWAEEVGRYLARDLRRRRPTTLVLLDLDGFKQVNDTHGHSAGDELLRHLAECWSRSLRKGDLLGRYGGDEFVLCLPETDERAAREVLERLSACDRATWSSGLATATGRDVAETVDALLARADGALYERKRAKGQAGAQAGPAPGSQGGDPAVR